MEKVGDMALFGGRRGVGADGDGGGAEGGGDAAGDGGGEADGVGGIAGEGGEGCSSGGGVDGGDIAVGSGLKNPEIEGTRRGGLGGQVNGDF